MKAVLLVEIEENLWMRKEVKIPILYVGIDLTLQKSPQAIIFDTVRVNGIEWNVTENRAYCFCEMEFGTHTSDEVVQKLRQRGWLGENEIVRSRWVFPLRIRFYKAFFGRPWTDWLFSEDDRKWRCIHWLWFELQILWWSYPQSSVQR